MSIHRVDPADRADVPFVKISRPALQDQRLSYKALGLLTHLLSRPHDWRVLLEELRKGEGREGRDAIRRALGELERFGYAKHVRHRDPTTKRITGWRWEIYEIAGMDPEPVTDFQELDSSEEPVTDFQELEAEGEVAAQKWSQLRDSSDWKPGPGNPLPGNPLPGNPTLHTRDKQTTELQTTETYSHAAKTASACASTVEDENLENPKPKPAANEAQAARPPEHFDPPSPRFKPRILQPRDLEKIAANPTAGFDAMFRHLRLGRFGATKIGEARDELREAQELARRGELVPKQDEPEWLRARLTRSTP